MLDYIDIKMCISHMERNNINSKKFLTGGCNCMMYRFVHRDDTTYNLCIFSVLTREYQPILCMNKSELCQW